MGGFNNPVVGALNLIRRAIRSPDYAAGSAGWSVNQDGSAEFNDLTVRGTVIIQSTSDAIFVYSGTPALGNLVASVANTNGTDAYGNKFPAAIGTETNGAFTARGDNTETNYLIAAVPASNEPIIIVNHDNASFTDGFIQSLKDGTTPYAGKITIQSTAPTGRNAGSLELLSQQSDGSAGPVLKVHADIKADGTLSGSSIAGSVNVSFAAQTSFTVNVTFPEAFATVPAVMTNIATGSGVAAHWDSRAIQITTTGFQVFVYAPVGGTAQTWANIPVQWIAVGT